MIENFREFQVGPDPYGRTWKVKFIWLQNGISIRHADTVDCKFVIDDGEIKEEKILALIHPELLKLSRKTGHPLNDAWCSKLAAYHLKWMIETAEDIEKTLVTLSVGDLERAHSELEKGRPALA